MPKRLLKWIGLAAIVELLFVVVYWAYDSEELVKFTHFLTFQVRDLNRARALLDGHMIFYGPEMTGGGHLPGPFYYWLLAAALRIGADWVSALTLLIGLSAAAAVCGGLFVRSRASYSAAGVWLGLFVLSATLENYIGVFLNVSYMTFFLVAAIVAICEAYGDGRWRHWSFVVACGLLGLTLQLHFSSFSLLLALAFLQIFAPSLGLRRAPTKTVITGLAALIVPMLPYLVWSAAYDLGHPFGQETLFAGSSQDAMPSLLQFLAVPPWKRIEHGLTNLAAGIPLALPFLVCALGADRLIHGRWVEPPTSDDRTKADWTIPALVCCLFGLLPALYVFAAPIGYRYSLAYNVGAIFLTVALFHRLNTRSRVLIFNLLTLSAILMIWAWDQLDPEAHDFEWLMQSRHFMVAALLLAALVLPQWRRKDKGPVFAAALILLLALMQNPSLWVGRWGYHNMSLPAAAIWYRITQRICEDTGWKASQLEERLYFVDGHMELDPKPIFERVPMQCDTMAQKKAVPSGYFLTFIGYYEERPFRDWVLEQPIPEEIKTGIVDGSIELGEEVDFNVIALIPYTVRDQTHLPPYFHNIGLGYSQTNLQDRIHSVGRPGQAVKTGKGEYLVMWNECKEHNAYCDTGLFVAVTPKGGSTEIGVLVGGDSLSQSSPWITPTWTESWNSPYLEAKCGSQVHHFQLAGNIGYNRKFSYELPPYAFYLSNHSFLAPFRRSLSVPCRVSELTVGRKSATVDQIQSTFELPGQRVTFSL